MKRGGRDVSNCATLNDDDEKEIDSLFVEAEKEEEDRVVVGGGVASGRTVELESSNE